MKALNALLVLAVLGSAAPLRAQPLEDGSVAEQFFTVQAKMSEARTRSDARVSSERRINALSQFLAKTLSAEGESWCGQSVGGKPSRLSVDENGILCGWDQRFTSDSWQIAPEELAGSGFLIVNGALVQGDADTKESRVSAEQLDAANAMVAQFFKYDITGEYRNADSEKTTALAEALTSIYTTSVKVFSCERRMTGSGGEIQMLDGDIVCRDHHGISLWRVTAEDFKGTQFELENSALTYSPRKNGIVGPAQKVSLKEIQFADGLAGSRTR